MRAVPWNLFQWLLSLFPGGLLSFFLFFSPLFVSACRVWLPGVWAVPGSAGSGSFACSSVVSQQWNPAACPWTRREDRRFAWSLWLDKVRTGYLKNVFLFTAERTDWGTRATDQTLCISDGCQNIQRFNTYFNKSIWLTAPLSREPYLTIHSGSSHVNWNWKAEAMVLRAKRSSSGSNS